MNLPATRWTKIKPTRTASNNNTTAARGARGGCMSDLTSSVGSQTFGSGRIGRQRAPAREAVLQFVPVRDFRFAEAPAQVNLAPVQHGPAVEQAREIVLQFDAELAQLLLQLAHLLLAAF